MARGALQVVGDRPVVLELELVFDEVREHGRHAAELGVSEGIAQAGVRQELAVGGLHALGYADHAAAVLLDRRVDAGEELVLLEGDLREQQDMRRLARRTSQASPMAAVVQPACRPIASRMNTRVEVRAIEATS